MFCLLTFRMNGKGKKTATKAVAPLTSLQPRQLRTSYLITYSQADLTRFPNREDFALLVVGLFNETEGDGRVDYWVCGKEEHRNTSGYHYHLALKLTEPIRYDSVQARLREENGVKVNFRDDYDMYVYAQRYCVKEDEGAVYSPNHPPLASMKSPRTKKAVAQRRANARAARAAAQQVSNEQAPSTSRPTTRSQTAAQREPLPPKVQRVGKFEVSRFIAENAIVDVDHLWAAARSRMDAGENDLAKFLIDRQSRPREISSLFEGNQKLDESLGPAERPAPRKRLEVLREVLRGSCVEGCEGRWFTCAIEILDQNRISNAAYAKSMRLLFEKGRGKRRNIMLIGPKDSGKTFLMDPVRKIFKTFLNPADDKYTWQDAEDCEVMFFNDFRWSKSMIRWNDLLVLLEGHPVRFPVPKNQRAKDILFTRDVPIFATSRSHVTFGKGRSYNDDVEGDDNDEGDDVVSKENAMMKVRWVVYRLPFTIRNIIELEPCPRCYANLVFYGDDTV